ncbi:MAG: GumC family protein [Candidatus Atribacteria bacterium]
MREDEEEKSLQEYIRVLRERKWTIFVIFITAIVAVLIANFLMQPIYKASTTVLLSESGTQQAIFSGVEGNIIFGRADEIETQIEILKSYSIAEGVVKKLPQDIFEKAEAQNFEKKKETFRWLINILDKLGLKRFIDSILGISSEKNNEEEKSNFDKIVKQVRGSISVNAVRNTNIIEINSENINPQLAAQIANTTANVFVEESRIINRSRATEAKKFIEEQLLEKEKELKQGEEEKLQYKQQENILYLDEETKINIEQLANFQAQEAEVDTQIAENKVKLVEVRKQLEKQAETYISSETITTNPIVQQLQSQLASLEIQLPTLLEKYTKGSSQVTEVEIKIKEIKNRISEKVAEIVGSKVSTRNPIYQSLLAQIVTLETNTISLNTKREVISKTIKKYEDRLEELPDKELHLARLERAIKVSENIYLLLLEKYQEARINEVMELGDIIIIDKALIPENSIKPNKKLNLAIGGVLGLMLGVMLVFFMEYMDNTIKTTEDVERILNLPTLGVIPKDTPEKKKKRKRKTKN